MADLPTYAELIILFGTAIGSGLAVKIHARRNNNNNQNDKNYKRPQMMSDETREETKDMWEKLQLIKTCDAKHEALDQRLKGIDKHLEGIGKDIRAILRKV